MSYQWGVVPISSGGNQTLTGVGGTGTGAIVIANESGLTCKITLVGGGQQKTLHPGMVNAFPVLKSSYAGQILIEPIALLANNASFPSQLLGIDIYGEHEAYGQYPINLMRSATTVSGSAFNVVNDTNISGTNVVEATVAGAGSSSLVLTNDGTVVLGSNLHPGSITITNGVNTIVLGSGGSITCTTLLTASGVSISNTIQLLNNNPLRINDTGATPHDVLYVDLANETCLQAATGFKILFKDNMGNNLMSLDPTNGNLRVKGSVTPNVVP